MGFDDGRKLCCDFSNGLVPGNLFKIVSDPFEWMRKALGMVLVAVNIQSLAAHVALTAWIASIRANLHNAVLVDLDLQAAVLGAQRTRGDLPFRHGKEEVFMWKNAGRR